MRIAGRRQSSTVPFLKIKRHAHENEKLPHSDTHNVSLIRQKKSEEMKEVLKTPKRMRQERDHFAPFRFMS